MNVVSVILRVWAAGDLVGDHVVVAPKTSTYLRDADDGHARVRALAHELAPLGQDGAVDQALRPLTGVHGLPVE